MKVIIHALLTIGIIALFITTPASALEACDPAPINPNEPHQLRPNPGQVCTPDIPQTARLTCGTDLVAQKTVTLARGGPGCYPAVGAIGQAVICTRDVSVSVPISIGLSGLELPIAGVASNLAVSDTLNPAQKMSQYTSWYLQGVISEGDEAKALADYMNGVINSTSGIGNLQLLSPAFNISSWKTPGLFTAMETAGAKFADLDGFAGNTYSLEGRGAYDWYADFIKGKVDQYGKKMLFTEFGDFATTTTQPDNRPNVVAAMKQEFQRTIGDSNILAANYFNALNTNPGFSGFALSPAELLEITQPSPSRGGVNSAAGVDGSGGFAQRVADLGLGWTVDIASSPGEADGVVSAFNAALGRGLTPILRICAGDTCDFQDPAIYGQFLREIAPRINGTFWAIAGPNEPDQEHWVSGAGGQTNQFNFIGPIKKLVADSVIDQKKTDLINAAVAGTAYNQIVGYAHNNVVISRLEAKNLLQQNPRRTDVGRIRLADMARHLNPPYNETDSEALKWYTLWRDMPFSQTVDLSGEIFATVSQADPNIKSASLSITSTLADFRVAFPHLVEDDQMSQLLQAVFRPPGVAETSGFTEPNAVDYSTVNRQTPFNTNYCDLRETYSNPGDSLETTRTITGNFNFTKTVTYSYIHGETDASGNPITTVNVDVSGPVSIFARQPPPVDNIYDRLVAGPAAIFKAIFPNPDQNLGGIKDLPAAAPISLNCGAGCTVKPANQAGRKAEIFFAHWGSVLNYFHDKLQTALDPLGRTSSQQAGASSSGDLACTMPLTSCSPVDWTNPLFNTYASAYNSDNNDSWSLIKEPWAQQLIDQTTGWGCPQFVSTLWLEESGGSAIGQYDLGCIYHLDGHKARTSDHRGGPANFSTYTAFKNHYEPILKDQLACLRSYVEPIGEDFPTFMCQYSGEADTDPTKPFRQCTTFTNNPNFPVNICKIGGEMGIATPN